MAEYLVSYEGWVIVEAEDEKQASYDVGTVLADSGIANDGIVGEWLITDVEESEEEDDE